MMSVWRRRSRSRSAVIGDGGAPPRAPSLTYDVPYVTSTNNIKDAGCLDSLTLLASSG